MLSSHLKLRDNVISIEISRLKEGSVGIRDPTLFRQWTDR